MAMWVIIRDQAGRYVRLVYHNLVQNQRYQLGEMAAHWPDQTVVDWIFENAEQLTPGDFIRLSNGKILQWDGRAFDPERWCRMRLERASA